jgi:hypothetical protein
MPSNDPAALQFAFFFSRLKFYDQVLGEAFRSFFLFFFFAYWPRVCVRVRLQAAPVCLSRDIRKHAHGLHATLSLAAAVRSSPCPLTWRGVVRSPLRLVRWLGAPCSPLRLVHWLGVVLALGVALALDPQFFSRPPHGAGRILTTGDIFGLTCRAPSGFRFRFRKSQYDEMLQLATRQDSRPLLSVGLCNKIDVDQIEEGDYPMLQRLVTWLKKHGGGAK